MPHFLLEDRSSRIMSKVLEEISRSISIGEHEGADFRTIAHSAFID